MRFSIATVSISGTLDQKIDAISQAGFDGIEIFENDLIAYSGSTTELAQKLTEKHLNVEAYQPFRDFEGMPEPLRSRAFDRAERKFDLMDKIGADLLMVCSNVSPQSLGGIGRAANDLHELGERAARRGMRIAYEALGWGKHINDYRDSWEIIRQVDHPSVGLCLDTFHIFSRNTEIRTLLKIPGDKIFLVQVADAPKLSMDPLSWSRHHRCFPGQGELNLENFMKNLADTGYDSVLSLEIFNDQFRSSDTFRHAQDAKRSLIFLSRGLEKPVFRKLTPIPPAEQPQEIEFIEFAINQEERPPFLDFLKRSGFIHAATHKVKDVELWEQGAIRIVINLNKKSFAQKYHSEHGLSVCAYGLGCRNPDAAVKRADALGYKILYADPEHDTHGMSAILGPTGTMLYLVETEASPSHWEREFIFHTTENDQILGNIDHIATTMPIDEVLEAKLLYSALFKMVASQAVTVADPLGNINSQVMEVDGKKLAMTLNSTLASRSSVAKIQSRYRGSGVNHIAFATSDIFSVAKKLKALNANVMDVTGNYYDDLSARFRLSCHEISELKSYHILYDEDEYGSFYQLFTKLFQGRFCFEFVQRTGYRGYGMANAHIRLTMQARELDSIGPP
jgi:4-hydroxyphenylpyruvate dioxygenase